MSKTIRVIDLLNKIAKGEKLPKKIMYENESYILKQKDYKNEERDIYLFGEEIRDISVVLNDTVQIIEEEPEIDIQGIEEIKFSESDKEYLGFGVDLAHSKINQIIRAVKQLDNQINNK